MFTGLITYYVLAKTKAQLIPKWAYVAVAVCVVAFFIYRTGVAHERARWVERAAAVERENNRLTKQISEQAAAAAAAENNRRMQEGQIDADLASNSNLDVFPDDWLRQLASGR